MTKKQTVKKIKKVSDLKINEARHHIARLYLYISIISITSIVVFKLAVTETSSFSAIPSILLVSLFCILAIVSLISSFVVTLDIKK